MAMQAGKEGDRGRTGEDNRRFKEAVLWIGRTDPSNEARTRRKTTRYVPRKCAYTCPSKPTSSQFKTHPRPPRKEPLDGGRDPADRPQSAHVCRDPAISKAQPPFRPNGQKYLRRRPSQ